MNGTEKQIKFAKSLVEKFDHEMNGLIDICPDANKPLWINTKEKLDSIFAEAYAGDVIDTLKGNYNSGKDYYMSFYVCVKGWAHPFARKIMKEVYGKE